MKGLILVIWFNSRLIFSNPMDFVLWKLITRVRLNHHHSAKYGMPTSHSQNVCQIINLSSKNKFGNTAYNVLGFRHHPSKIFCHVFFEISTSSLGSEPCRIVLYQFLILCYILYYAHWFSLSILPRKVIESL